jgi:hypothetical protein
MQAYLADSYDFVNLSDHNVNTTDPGVTGITFIEGCEETNSWGHMGLVNMATHVSPIDTPYKNTIYSNAHAANGFVVFNHPLYTTMPMTLTILMATEFDAVEYLNGYRSTDPDACPNDSNCALYTCMPIPQVDCDAMWSMGRRFYITAGDDCHDVPTNSCQQRNNVWNMVNSEDKSHNNIVANIQAGNFYVSDGAVISNVSVSGNAITVTVPVTSTITFQVQNATIAQTNTSVTTATYNASSDDIYVLIRVVRASDSKQAFAQPLFNDAARPAPFLSKIGSFTNPSTTGNLAVTGVGFRPRAIITWITPISNAWGTDAQFSIGVGTTGAAGYSAFAGQNGVATSVEERRMVGSDVAGLIQYTGTALCEGTLTSLDADGFTINWTTANATAFTFHYLALGGHRLMQASVAGHTQKATIGTLAVTGTAFKPDCIFTIADVSSLNTTGVTSVLMLGAADNSGNEWAQYNYAANGVTTTNAGRSQRTDCCIYGTGNTLGVAYKATLQSMDANGFTLNWTTTDGNTTRQFLTLCLKGGGYQVGAWNKSTAAAPTTDTISGLTGTGTTLTPASVFATTWSHAASTSGQTGMRVTIGASDGTNYHTAGATDKHGSTTGSVVRKFGSTNETLIVADNDTGTSEAVGMLGTFAAGSFQASWPTTNNSTATQICYVAFGQLDVTAPAATAPLTHTANISAVNVSTTTPNSAGTTLSANLPLPNVDVVVVAPSATSTFKANLYSSTWNSPSYQLTIPASGTLDVGPFDVDIYTKIRFTHTVTTNVTMETIPDDVTVSVTSPQRVTYADGQTFHFINSGGTADILTIQPVYCPQ